MSRERESKQRESSRRLKDKSVERRKKMLASKLSSKKQVTLRNQSSLRSQSSKTELLMVHQRFKRPSEQP